MTKPIYSKLLWAAVNAKGELVEDEFGPVLGTRMKDVTEPRIRVRVTVTEANRT